MHATTLQASGMPRSRSWGNLQHAPHGPYLPPLHPMSRLRGESGISRAMSQQHLAVLHSGHATPSGSRRVSMNGGQQEQQSVEATASTATASVAPAQTTQAGAPYASLSRVLLIGQPSNLVRNLAARKWRAAGPISLLLFLFGFLVAIMAAVRTALVRRVKSCKCCKGYGIVRCRLCDGKGSVEWRGKNDHLETCPLCMTKRFVTCPDCGGHYHKRMFAHSKGPINMPEFQN